MDRAARQKYQKQGRRAESYACAYLSLTGWRLVARNLRTPASEVDAVAVRGNVLALIEVKRRRTFAAAGESLDAQTLSRLETAAEWLAGHSPYAVRPNGRAREVRLDLILVAGWRIRHIKGGWHDQ